MSLAKLLTVVELSCFISQADRLVTENEKNDIISYLAAHPEEGDEIPQTGGLRKIRFGSQHKGKRGGYRVIYYFYNQYSPLFLLDIYRKSEREDLSSEQKKHLTTLVKVLKQECKRQQRL